MQGSRGDTQRSTSRRRALCWARGGHFLPDAWGALPATAVVVRGPRPGLPDALARGRLGVLAAGGALRKTGCVLFVPPERGVHRGVQRCSKEVPHHCRSTPKCPNTPKASVPPRAAGEASRLCDPQVPSFGPDTPEAGDLFLQPQLSLGTASPMPPRGQERRRRARPPAPRGDRPRPRSPSAWCGETGTPCQRLHLERPAWQLGTSEQRGRPLSAASPSGLAPGPPCLPPRSALSAARARASAPAPTLEPVLHPPPPRGPHKQPPLTGPQPSDT